MSSSGPEGSQFTKASEACPGGKVFVCPAGSPQLERPGEEETADRPFPAFQKMLCVCHGRASAEGQPWAKSCCLPRAGGRREAGGPGRSSGWMELAGIGWSAAGRGRSGGGEGRQEGGVPPRLADGARFWYFNLGFSFWPFVKSSDLMMRLFFL